MLTFKTPVLVAIYSPAPQSGKTTVSNILRHQHAFSGIKIAAALKDMLTAALIHSQIDVEPSVYIEGSRKELPVEIFGNKTTRYAMQTLALWGKEHFGQDFWLRFALAGIRSDKKYGFSSVVDDMRYGIEYDALKAEGAIMVKVVRPGTKAPANHFGSEGNLNDYPFDITLINDFKDVESFQEFAEYVLLSRIKEIVHARS
jgi:hypothetical protein